MKELKEFLSSLDLSDVRLLIIGCILLIVPLAYLFFISRTGDDSNQPRTYSLANTSRQSAFNLTVNKKASGLAPQAKKSSGFNVSPTADKIEEELGKAWNRIQSIPKVRHIPNDVPIETKQMWEAEDDEVINEGNMLLDSCEYAAAEENFLKAVKNSGSNDFKELYAYGGLMEVYQVTGNIVKFREAFANYVKVAQKLKHVYGPLADNIARAQQMFEQLNQADPAMIREHLAKYNLSNGTKVTYEEFRKSLDDTKQWFPTNLPEPEPKMPDYLHREYGG